MRRRLRWLPDMTAVSEISNDGRSATRAVGYERQPWTASGLLPMAGKSSWSVCEYRTVDESAAPCVFLRSRKIGGGEVVRK